jgi:hypothetical protein
MDISLLQLDPDTGEITIKMQSRVVYGVQKLLQLVILSLLNKPGKDIITPERGSGLLDMVAGNYDPSDIPEIAAELTQKIRKTEVEVIQAQTGRSVPPNERLKEVTILSINQGETIDQIWVRIKVTNELGQSAEAVV